MFTSIAGRSVIITGASKGIGKGIARAFARAGARLLLVARKGDLLAQTAEELEQHGTEVKAFIGDVSKSGDMVRMAEAAVTAYGCIDILCCNAGIFPSARLADMQADDWQCVIDTNLGGTFLAVKSCLPAMQSRGWGRIIVISSITGPITGCAGWSHYAASKAGQLGFMRSAALELAGSKITINAILPGNIATEGLNSLGPDYTDQMTAAIPLGRLGSVEDVAHAALFFASDGAGFITGQTLVVDGGQVLPESSPSWSLAMPLP